MLPAPPRPVSKAPIHNITDVNKLKNIISKKNQRYCLHCYYLKSNKNNFVRAQAYFIVVQIIS